MLRACRLALALASVITFGALAASPFDGKYRGQRTVLRGAPPSCTAPGNTTWAVAGGRVSIKYGHVPIAADVGPDGSFRTNVPFSAGRFNANATLTGRITDGALEAILETYACKYQYALTRI